MPPPFKDLMNENSGHYYTNQELYQLFDLMNPELLHFYDNFDWGHCHTSHGAHAMRSTHGRRQAAGRCSGHRLLAPIFWEARGSEHARAAPSARLLIATAPPSARSSRPATTVGSDPVSFSAEGYKMRGLILCSCLCFVLDGVRCEANQEVEASAFGSVSTKERRKADASTGIESLIDKAEVKLGDDAPAP